MKRQCQDNAPRHLQGFLLCWEWSTTLDETSLAVISLDGLIDDFPGFFLVS